jgi:hypothetical protein
MRVTEVFDGQCTAPTFVSADRSVPRKPARCLASTVIGDAIKTLQFKLTVENIFLMKI